MKKILVLMAFIFSVAFYAGSHPLLVPNFNTEQIEIVIQGNYSTVGIECVQELEFSHEAVVSLFADINKPVCSCGSFNQLNYCKANKQNSNYRNQFNADN